MTRIPYIPRNEFNRVLTEAASRFDSAGGALGEALIDACADKSVVGVGSFDSCPATLAGLDPNANTNVVELGATIDGKLDRYVAGTQPGIGPLNFSQIRITES